MKSRHLSLALIGLVVGLMLKSAVETIANSMSGRIKPEVMICMITIAILLVIMAAFFIQKLQGLGIFFTATLIGSAIANIELPYVAIVVIIALLVAALVILIEEISLQESKRKKRKEERKEGERER